MASPFKKAGGGFLNNVTGVILGFSFDTDLTGETKEGGTWRKLNGKLTVKVDGADEPVETYVDGGFLYDENITVDGAVIGGTDECPVRENTELAGLALSMVEGGLAEDELGNGLDYTFMTGLRCTFVKVKDEERTKRQGKRKDKNTGKEYDYELLRVSKVLGREVVKAGKAAPKATAGKSGAKATSKPAPAPAAAPSSDVADTALLTIVDAAKDKTVKQDAIEGLFIKYALKNNIGQADREPIRNQLKSDEYLTGAAERGLITFEPKNGKGIIKATE